MLHYNDYLVQLLRSLSDDPEPTNLTFSCQPHQASNLSVPTLHRFLILKTNKHRQEQDVIPTSRSSPVANLSLAII